MEGRVQTGIVACASIDDYLSGVIKKHENTREDKELDRIRHVDVTDAHTGPIFLAYRGNEALKRQMEDAAISLFGSGWAWLSLSPDGKLVITKESNAGNPLRQGNKPLLCIDVWEHAYYIDYRNRRADHVKSLWQIIDWQVVAGRL